MKRIALRIFIEKQKALGKNVDVEEEKYNKPNFYDRGVLSNIWEVFVAPPKTRTTNPRKEEKVQ